MRSDDRIVAAGAVRYALCKRRQRAKYTSNPYSIGIGYKIEVIILAGFLILEGFFL
jgi:hypothetical protein